MKKITETQRRYGYRRIEVRLQMERLGLEREAHIPALPEDSAAIAAQPAEAAEAERARAPNAGAFETEQIKMVAGAGVGQNLGPSQVEVGAGGRNHQDLAKQKSRPVGAALSRDLISQFEMVAGGTQPSQIAFPSSGIIPWFSMPIPHPPTARLKYDPQASLLRLARRRRPYSPGWPRCDRSRP